MDTLSTELLIVVALFLLIIVLLLVLLRPAKQRGLKGERPERSPISTPSSAPVPRSEQHKPDDVPFVLSAVAGSLAGQQFAVPQTGLRIGRDADNDVMLVEPMVSRQHAHIIARSDGIVLYDRNSVNGVFVDGIRTFEKLLQPGNRIQIGLAEFVFLSKGAPVPEPPSVPPVQSAAVSPGRALSHAARSFDSFRIEGLIGGGGMADVYRARLPDGHLVAVKIPKVAKDPYLMRKFEKEGNRIGALLRGHPHIVQIERFGYNRDGIPYIIMEYVDGGSLRDRIRREMSEEEIRRIIGQTCLALAFAHQYAIVHRDVKPENILLTSAGDVKVADFGIAKELTGVTVTHSGPVGTPEYMSPEQALGETVAPASDIYAVGVVAYELLTGQVPFPRRSNITDDVQQALDVVERHIRGTPRPPHLLRVDVPASLETFVLRALEKDPHKRYKDGKEAAKALGYDKNILPKPTNTQVAKLVVIEGSQQGNIIRLASDVMEIGRAEFDPENTLISRRHIVLRRRGGDYWLEDVSTNGTWINNQRVSGEQLITAGDSIRIGTAVLRLEL